MLFIIEFKIIWCNCCLISKIIKGIFHVFSIGTWYWPKPISLQERQSNHQGRVITYVKRATRNYPVMFGNVANGDILIYWVLTFHNYYRSPRFIVLASSLSSNKHKSQFIVPASSLLIWCRTILGNYNNFSNIKYSPRSSNCHSFRRFPKEIKYIGQNKWAHLDFKHQSFATKTEKMNFWKRLSSISRSPI